MNYLKKSMIQLIKLKNDSSNHITFIKYNSTFFTLIIGSNCKHDKNNAIDPIFAPP